MYLVYRKKIINELSKDELEFLESVVQKYYREMGVKSSFFMYHDMYYIVRNPDNPKVNSLVKIIVGSKWRYNKKRVQTDWI